MRKLFVSLLCVAVAVPAVALAADVPDPVVTGGIAHAKTEKTEATFKGRWARDVLARRAHRAEERRERARNKKKNRQTASAPARPASRGQQAQGGGGASAGLESIAACESGGNPSAVGGGGRYRGKYQFDQQTWNSVGGSGDPAAAPEAEQDRRAAMLMARSGTSPWPNCGK